MKLPIKDIILGQPGKSGTLLESKFFDNIANGKKNFNYTEKQFQKDKNVLKFSSLGGGAGGAVAGQALDSMIDGDYTDENGNLQDEPMGNGAAIGAIIGAGGTSLYGLNNNHKFITKDLLNRFRRPPPNN